MGNVFDALAGTYDDWYDMPEGRAIFGAERDCLLSLCRGPFSSWLEVGVGSGRFAHALGITTGVDPSPKMLGIAAGRGINACVVSGQNTDTATHMSIGRGVYGGKEISLQDWSEKRENSVKLRVVALELVWPRGQDSNTAVGGISASLRPVTWPKVPPRAGLTAPRSAKKTATRRRWPWTIWLRGQDSNL